MYEKGTLFSIQSLLLLYSVPNQLKFSRVIARHRLQTVCKN